MIPAERQRELLTHLAQRGILSIAELTALLGVSHMTVRRDIQHLEKRGRVTTVSGGVRLPERLAWEPSHDVKFGIKRDEKTNIGRVAATLVDQNATLYLDAGTTTLEIARNLADRTDITVVTNDFQVAAYLTANASCTLYHSGGLVERANQSCVGEAAAEALRHFNFDICFISASSWTISGLSTPQEIKGAVKQAVVAQSARRVLVSDSSKYGIIAAFNIMSLDVFDAVITDTGLQDSVTEALGKKNIQVIFADQLGDSR